MRGNHSPVSAESSSTPVVPTEPAGPIATAQSAVERPMDLSPIDLHAISGSFCSLIFNREVGQCLFYGCGPVPGVVNRSKKQIHPNRGNACVVGRQKGLVVNAKHDHGCSIIADPLV